MVETPYFIKRIDWEELNNQKQFLINLKTDEADGVVNLLDEFQDYCVDVLGIPEDVVFKSHFDSHLAINYTPYKTTYEGMYGKYPFELEVFEDDYYINWILGKPRDYCKDSENLERRIYESFKTNNEIFQDGKES